MILEPPYDNRLFKKLPNLNRNLQSGQNLILLVEFLLADIELEGHGHRFYSVLQVCVISTGGESKNAAMVSH